MANAAQSFIDPLSGNGRYRAVRDLPAIVGRRTILAEDTRKSGEAVVIQLVQRGPSASADRLFMELRNLRRLVGCHHFLGLRRAFLAPTFMCIVTDYASMGNLFQYIRQKGTALAEHEARWFFQQLLVAVHTAHTANIAVREIALESCLLKPHPTPGKMPLLQLGTLCLSKDDAEADAKTLGLTVHYLAPEMTRGHYEPRKVDFYLLGVCLYTMLARSYPFIEPREQKLQPLQLLHIVKEECFGLPRV